MKPVGRGEPLLDTCGEETHRPAYEAIALGGQQGAVLNRQPWRS